MKEQKMKRKTRISRQQREFLEYLTAGGSTLWKFYEHKGIVEQGISIFREEYHTVNSVKERAYQRMAKLLTKDGYVTSHFGPRRHLIYTLTDNGRVRLMCNSKGEVPCSVTIHVEEVK